MKKFWKWCLIVKDKKNIYKNNWIETGEIPKGFKAYELNDFINKKNFKIIVIIISVLVLILAVFSMNFKKKEEKKSPIATISGKQVESTNILMKFENGDVKKADKNEKYNVYIDKLFNFYCAIPQDYKISNSGDSVNRVVLENKDSDIKIFVGASENKFNLKIKELMDQYISSFGKVDYKANGDNWYAVSKYYNGVSYYKKTFLKEGKILWFEFNIKDDPTKNPEKKKNIEEMIEFMEDNFNIIKK